MRSFTILLAPALLWLPTSLADSARNLKRGLAYTPNDNWPEDDKLWSDAAEKGVLSWYYNFGWEASKAYESVPQSTFEFVPLMWGAATANGTDSYFAGNISEIIDKGRDITHVMMFSQPDGSGIKPKIAARSWINNAVPLQAKGVKVGLPIVGDPYNWVTPFLANCSDILANKEKKPNKRDGGARDEPAAGAGSGASDKKPACKFDFVPITSYGNMSTLKDRVELFATA